METQVLGVKYVINDEIRTIGVIWVSWDLCDTPHQTCNCILLENIFHYQNDILSLIFSTDFSVASIVCLVV